MKRTTVKAIILRAPLAATSTHDRTASAPELAP